MLDINGPIPVIEDVAPAFVETPEEKAAGVLSPERQQEKAAATELRAKLEPVFRVLNRLQGALEGSQRETGRVRTEAVNVRKGDVEFLKHLLGMHGIMSALAQTPGEVSLVWKPQAEEDDDKDLQPGTIEAKLTYGQAKFEMCSTTPGDVVVKQNDKILETIHLGQEGIKEAELIGLASIFRWRGPLPADVLKLLPSPEQRRPAQTPSQPDTLRDFLRMVTDMQTKVTFGG